MLTRTISSTWQIMWSSSLLWMMMMSFTIREIIRSHTHPRHHHHHRRSRRNDTTWRWAHFTFSILLLSFLLSFFLFVVGQSISRDSRCLRSTTSFDSTTPSNITRHTPFVLLLEFMSFDLVSIASPFDSVSSLVRQTAYGLLTTCILGTAVYAGYRFAIVQRYLIKQHRHPELNDQVSSTIEGHNRRTSPSHSTRSRKCSIRWKSPMNNWSTWCTSWKKRWLSVSHPSLIPKHRWRCFPPMFDIFPTAPNMDMFSLSISVEPTSASCSSICVAKAKLSWHRRSSSFHNPSWSVMANMFVFFLSLVSSTFVLFLCLVVSSFDRMFGWIHGTRTFAQQRKMLSTR